MTGTEWLDAALFLFSLFIATMVAIAEAAITAASRSRLEEMADRHDIAARHALRLKDGDEDRQATVQIASALLLVVASMLIAPYLLQWAIDVATWSQQPWLNGVFTVLAVLFVGALIASVFLLWTVLFGRAIGARYAEALVLRVAGGFLSLHRVLRPLQRLNTAVAQGFLGPFKANAAFHASVTTEENLMDILEDGAKTGLLDRTEHELIESIFQFTETTAREIMIPRTDVVAVEIGMPADSILETFLEEGFTRMPVYRESMDNVLGVVYAKDVISLVQHRDLIILQDIIRPAYIVPETKPISDLLREFQLKRLHMAIVVDEFGGTEGIITMEDILEEIVGDIRDEYDEEESPFALLPDGSVEVEAMENISDFNTYTEYTIPESDDYDTIGGFVTSLFGRIPEAGEFIDFEDMRIDVLEAEDRRVIRVRLSRVEADTAS